MSASKWPSLEIEEVATAVYAKNWKFSTQGGASDEVNRVISKQTLSVFKAFVDSNIRMQAEANRTGLCGFDKGFKLFL